jgi:CBS domain containing-hemolysin-like protein
VSSNDPNRLVIAVLAGVSVLVVLYSLIIAQQILLGVLAAVALWFVYLCYRLVCVLGQLASALERLVEQRTD